MTNGIDNRVKFFGAGYKYYFDHVPSVQNEHHPLTHDDEYLEIIELSLETQRSHEIGSEARVVSGSS